MRTAPDPEEAQMANENGTLTTHVLDTARGTPAAGMGVELYRIEGDVRLRLRTATTNSDGRTDIPLIGRGEMFEGIYELIFYAGDYISRTGGSDTPLFLDVIPIRFAVSDANAKLHVPLLLSPYGYSTYRGS